MNTQHIDAIDAIDAIDPIDAGYDHYRLAQLVAAVSAFVASADLSQAPAAELLRLHSELSVSALCVGGELEIRERPEMSAASAGPDLPF